ncbi:MAG: GAF domain-containing protein, partial [Synergistaceae bacterium]|nr:GAF domain-containing protein [Synergistaceae bacterium]
NKSRKGYTLSEGKTGHIKATLDTTLLPSSSGAISNEKISEPHYDLGVNSPDSIFRSWGLAGCPWKEAFKSSSIKYIFPICDDNSLVGIIALGSGQGGRLLDRSQLASLQLIAQFAAYEFRRFE